jgi:c-di-GMP-binding flagellar brake protein YcgR
MDTGPVRVGRNTVGTRPRAQVVWSRFHIIRLLRHSIRERRPVSVQFGPDEKVLLTRAVHLNARTDRVAFAFGDHKDTNTQLLHSSPVLFSLDEGQVTYRFAAREVFDVLLHGEPIFEVALPDAVLYADRRYHRRLRFPRIVAPVVWIYLPDGTRFEGRLSDMSDAGLGVIGIDENIPVRKGSVLRNCAIGLGGSRKAWVDVEVRYIREIAPLSGRPGKRIGFRLITPAPDLEKLLRNFAVEL